MTDPQTQPTAAELVAQQERDLTAALGQISILTTHLVGVRDTLVHLVQQLDALGDTASAPSAAAAAVIRAVQPDRGPIGPRLPRQSPEERDLIDTAVLGVLRKHGGEEVKVETITCETGIAPGEVSKSVQRLCKRDDVGVRPGDETGPRMPRRSPEEQSRIDAECR